MEVYYLNFKSDTSVSTENFAVKIVCIQINVNDKTLAHCALIIAINQKTILIL